jgi:RsiW-degrading membrane proteinase PrsW (M82 family)
MESAISSTACRYVGWWAYCCRRLASMLSTTFALETLLVVGHVTSASSEAAAAAVVAVGDVASSTGLGFALGGAMAWELSIRIVDDDSCVVVVVIDVLWMGLICCETMTVVANTTVISVTLTPPRMRTECIVNAFYAQPPEGSRFVALLFAALVCL